LRHTFCHKNDAFFKKKKIPKVEKIVKSSEALSELYNLPCPYARAREGGQKNAKKKTAKIKLIYQLN
jgi:hypothetical protein